MINKKTFFFDMDGVLAIYERHAYVQTGKNKPLWLDEEKHYFRYLKLNSAVKNMMTELIALGYRCYILTAVPETAPWIIPDKKICLKEQFPLFDMKRLIIATSDKAELACAKMHIKKLTSNAILIDDFNKNLEQWRNAGGTAIKYLNGINSADSYSGPKISGYERPSRLMRLS